MCMYIYVYTSLASLFVCIQYTAKGLLLGSVFCVFVSKEGRFLAGQGEKCFLRIILIINYLEIHQC